MTPGDRHRPSASSETEPAEAWVRAGVSRAVWWQVRRLVDERFGRAVLAWTALIAGDGTVAAADRDEYARRNEAAARWQDLARRVRDGDPEVVRSLMDEFAIDPDRPAPAIPPAAASQKRLPRSERASRRGSVLVHVPLAAEFGTAAERAELLGLEDELEAALGEEDAGELDGNEYGANECVFYLYGRDPDALLEVVAPHFRRSPFRGVYAVKRDDADDERAPEARVDL